jgi:hypothetical protein
MVKALCLINLYTQLEREKAEVTSKTGIMVEHTEDNK